MLKEGWNDPPFDDKGHEPGQHQDGGWLAESVTTVGPDPQNTKSNGSCCQSLDAGIRNDLECSRDGDCKE